MVENEENVKELEAKESETDVKENEGHKSEVKNVVKETETGKTTEDQQTSENPENPANMQDVPLEPQQQPLFTSELIETNNFTLQIDHHMTVGDMLVSTLLVANIAVILLCRLLRDRK